MDCIIQISDSNDVLLTTTHDRGSVIAHNGDNNYNNLICVATHCNDFAYCGKFNAHSLPAWRRACFIETWRRVQANHFERWAVWLLWRNSSKNMVKLLNINTVIDANHFQKTPNITGTRVIGEKKNNKLSRHNNRDSVVNVRTFCQHKKRLSRCPYLKIE